MELGAIFWPWMQPIAVIPWPGLEGIRFQPSPKWWSLFREKTTAATIRFRWHVCLGGLNVALKWSARWRRTLASISVSINIKLESVIHLSTVNVMWIARLTSRLFYLKPSRPYLNPKVRMGKSKFLSTKFNRPRARKNFSYFLRKPFSPTAIIRSVLCQY